MVCFRVADLPLLDGTYRVTVSLHTRGGLRYDHWEQHVPVEVKAPGRDVGVVRLATKIQVEPGRDPRRAQCALFREGRRVTEDPPTIDVTRLAAEIAEEVRARRAAGDFPPGLERELDAMFARYAPAGTGDDFDDVLASAETQSFIHADVPTGSRRAPLVLVKRVLRSAMAWYVRFLAQQVTAFAGSITRAVTLLARRVDTLETVAPTLGRPLDPRPRRVGADRGGRGRGRARPCAPHRVGRRRRRPRPGRRRRRRGTASTPTRAPRWPRRGRDWTSASTTLSPTSGGCPTRRSALSCCRAASTSSPSARCSPSPGAPRPRSPRAGRSSSSPPDRGSWAGATDPVAADLSPGRPLHAETWAHVLTTAGLAIERTLPLPAAAPPERLTPLPADVPGAEILNADLDRLSRAVFGAGGYARRRPQAALNPWSPSTRSCRSSRRATRSATTHCGSARRCAAPASPARSSPARSWPAPATVRARSAAPARRGSPRPSRARGCTTRRPDRRWRSGSPTCRARRRSTTTTSRRRRSSARGSPTSASSCAPAGASWPSWPTSPGGPSPTRPTTGPSSPASATGGPRSSRSCSTPRSWPASRRTPTLLTALEARKAAEGGADWLFVSRLLPHKGQHDLIKAFAAYRLAYDPAARLTLVGAAGSARYAEALADFVADLALDDAVAFTGSVSDAELAARYRVADVYTSASAHEGFGVPLVEAMAHGVPIVALASSAVPETVGTAGILLPSAEPAAFAAAVHRVTTDPALAAALTAAGRARLAELDAATTGRRLVDAVGRILAAAGLS